MKHFLNCKFIVLLLFTVSCNTPEPSQEEQEQQLEKWKEEVAATEKAFSAMAQKEGLIKAFEFYAAEDGVIRRKKEIIQGKKAIADWYTKDVRSGDTLVWSPTFVDVSQSGDMAYTYGDFQFSYLDTLGNKIENRGIFHTVWKRQADGKWRFVWD